MTADEYYAQLAAALAAGPPPELERAAELLERAVRDGRALFVFGNGASAALASHVATDLGKGLADVAPVRIESLTDNAALVTAYANDVAYERVFVEQLRVRLRPGDVAIGISAGGLSPNVVQALEEARLLGGLTVALTGARPGGERLSACCDVVVRAPLEAIEQIEDLHVVFAHILLRLLRERLSG